MVRPKKHLGQHFLRDLNIARQIVDALPANTLHTIEVGPGTGVLTNYLASRENLYLIDVDRESIAYLHEKFPQLGDKIILGDFLELSLANLHNGPWNVIGNFPYNISSQIFFKVLEQRHIVQSVVGMVQKEVAQRIASPPGSRDYGILSVLLQAYYDIKLLFTVPPGVFQPPPKVNSAVLSFTRNQVPALSCDEALFVKVVKQAFQQRRKTLRNALKSLVLPPHLIQHPMLDLRAERLGVNDFVFLTNELGKR